MGDRVVVVNSDDNSMDVDSTTIDHQDEAQVTEGNEDADRSLSPVLSSSSIVTIRSAPLSLASRPLPHESSEAPEEKSVPQKKCKCDAEPSRSKRKSADEDEDDGKLCPICFDVWSNSGEHRLCALRCGHLFGHCCLLRWLTGQKTCPTCKSTVRKTDIRFIYAKKLIALDTSELDAVRLELDNEKCDKNRVQIELMQCKQREELQRKEILVLKSEVKTLKTRAHRVTAATSQVASAQKNTKIYREKSLEISKDGGSRVMDYYRDSHLLVVSSPSPNQLFSGYGVRKVSVKDFKSSAFIPLHSNTIRDLAFHQQRELLLSVAVDKSAKLTETANNNPVFSVQRSGPIWSCCWDASNPNCFFLGEQCGLTVKYDLRKPNEELSVLQISGDCAPVIAVASAGWNPGGALPQGGTLVCKLNSCSVFVPDNNSTSVVQHPLSLEGPFVSMRYDAVTQHLLVTSRPTSRTPFTRHALCVMSKTSTSTAVSCETLHVFQGAPVQKLLSRSCQVSVAGDIFVAAHHEPNRTVDVYSVSRGFKTNSLPAHYPVFDLCPIAANSMQYLCALNEKKLDLFKIDTE